MDFIDELGKKISQAGQNAVQKGKELVDIAKLNSAVCDEEKKMDNNYREIGKLYVSLCGEHPEVDFAALVAEIHESENKILDYKHKIKDIKGVVCCEKCGAEFIGNAAYCSACGAPMPVVKPVETQPEEEPAEAESESADAQAEAESGSADVHTEAAPENAQEVSENDQMQADI